MHTSPDFFTTLLELAGLPRQPAAHVDGRSFAAVLHAPDTRLPERPLFWHYPHYSNQRGRPHGVIRTGSEPAVASDLLKQLRATWNSQLSESVFEDLMQATVSPTLPGRTSHPDEPTPARLVWQLGKVAFIEQ